MMEKHLVEGQGVQHFQNTFVHKGHRAGALTDYKIKNGNYREVIHGHGYPKKNLNRVMKGVGLVQLDV